MIASGSSSVIITTTPKQERISQCVLSGSISLTKTVKIGPHTILAKRLLYRVFFNNADLTPDDIYDSSYVSMDSNAPHAAFDMKSRTKSEANLRLSVASKSKILLEGPKAFATTINLDDIQIDHSLNTEEGIQLDDGNISLAPSAFYLPKENPITSYPPEILVTLKETQTVFLFALPSLTFEKGSHDANYIEEENAYYEYITVGKGSNRKMVGEETQTKETIMQTRHTIATRPEKKNATSFASLWDMLDTYDHIARTMMEEEEEDEMVMYQSAASYLLRKKRKKIKDLKLGKTFAEIAVTRQYLDAVLLMERVLASLVYSDAQKTFRALLSGDPLSLDLVYIYTINHLWTYECEDTINKPISSISFNPKFPDICAIAHGKFGYADVCQGLVCVWSIKNPRKPERLYRFESPVTFVSFSDNNPNWLACGFCNGDVIILDITSYSIKTVAKSKRDTNPCFEPIWAISWRRSESGNEIVMTACQDGRIRRWQRTKTHDFISTPMMRVCTVEGNLPGLKIANPCMNVDVPITRNPAVLCMIWHSSIEHCYLVGTDEGCIHKCSTHYLNQHMDVFRAHAGPVTDMCTSPVMTYLVASCGADNAIRLWIEGMDEMILTLVCQNAVNGIAFCPINATILLSASGNTLSVWDLRRKTHVPCAEHIFPGNIKLTYVRITPSGQNIFVGDTLGRLHTFHLEDTPIPPYDQKKVLYRVLQNALCNRPKMLKQLDILVRLNERDIMMKKANSQKAGKFK